MKTTVAVLTVLVAVTVGAWGYACEVHASVQNYVIGQLNTVHVVFAIDAQCGGNHGCGGTLAYVVTTKFNNAARRYEGSSSWHTTQSGSATAEGDVRMLPSEEVVSVYVKSVTCE
ncbi:MAG: hypothetical protein ABR961_09335 [Thermoanaerobaculaceae bacterium]|jgi:hypothetical protein